jgi:hypothetical protein
LWYLRLPPGDPADVPASTARMARERRAQACDDKLMETPIVRFGRATLRDSRGKRR